MISETKPEKIRLHLTVLPDSPTYALLAACPTPQARRVTALSLMASTAAALGAGVASPAPATAKPKPPLEAVEKPQFQPHGPDNSFALSKGMAAITSRALDIDFDDL